MLRRAILILFATVTTGAAFGADLPAAYHVRRHAPSPAIIVGRDPDSLISSFPSTPLLPGSSTLPGYYGRAFDYDYQGPYYGGPEESYFFRLPYACGVYGYC